LGRAVTTQAKRRDQERNVKIKQEEQKEQLEYNNEKMTLVRELSWLEWFCISRKADCKQGRPIVIVD